jgi:hypothetical protein
MAIAANRPIMATTIMISTRVKPALRVTLVFFIFFSLFYEGGGTQRQAGYDNDNLVPVLPDATAMVQTAATL